MSARGSRNALARPVVRARASASHDGLGAILVRRQIDLDAVPAQPLARWPGRPRRAARPSSVADVADGEQPLHERRRRALALVNTIQSKSPASAHAPSSGAVDRRRRDPDHRRLDRLGAALLEHVDQLARLLARPRDEDALAEERPRVEPAQVLAQPDHGADDQDAPAASVARAGSAMSPSVPAMRLLRRQRAVVDQRRRVVGGAAVRQQRVGDRAAAARAPA